VSSRAKLFIAGSKYAGTKIKDIVKTLKRNNQPKKTSSKKTLTKSKRPLFKQEALKANTLRARLKLKSIKPYQNVSSSGSTSKSAIVPAKSQSQKGSSFKTHEVKGNMAGSRAGTDSAESWRIDMERLTNMPSFNELRRSVIKKKRKALGGVASFSRGGDNMPARNKKNFRSTKSGAGMTAAGVAAYRRKNPGSKLTTAVTEDKPGKKRAARRKSYCARSAGQMKMFPKAAKDPNSRLRQARRRWKC